MKRMSGAFFQSASRSSSISLIRSGGRIEFLSSKVFLLLQFQLL